MLQTKRHCPDDGKPFGVEHARTSALDRRTAMFVQPIQPIVHQIMNTGTNISLLKSHKPVKKWLRHPQACVMTRAYSTYSIVSVLSGLGALPIVPFYLLLLLSMISQLSMDRLCNSDHAPWIEEIAVRPPVIGFSRVSVKDRQGIAAQLLYNFRQLNILGMTIAPMGPMAQVPFQAKRSLPKADIGSPSISTAAHCCQAAQAAGNCPCFLLLALCRKQHGPLSA